MKVKKIYFNFIILFTFFYISCSNNNDKIKEFKDDKSIDNIGASSQK